MDQTILLSIKFYFYSSQLSTDRNNLFRFQSSTWTPDSHGCSSEWKAAVKWMRASTQDLWHKTTAFNCPEYETDRKSVSRHRSTWSAHNCTCQARRLRARPHLELSRALFQGRLIHLSLRTGKNKITGEVKTSWSIITASCKGEMKRNKRAWFWYRNNEEWTPKSWRSSAP